MKKRPGFARFAASSALVTSLAVVIAVAPQPARAQVLPTGGVVQAGTVTLRGNGNFVGTGDGTIATPFVTAAGNNDGLGLVVGGANTVLTWDSFSIGATNNVAFSRSGNAAFTVLNIVTGPTASDLRGALTGDGNGSIWLINPNGIAFNGAGSATNLASLVLSTLALTEVNGAAYNAATFTGANGNSYRFAGAGTAGITIASGGSLASGSNLLLVAPQINSAGTLTATGSAALVVAANTRVAVSAAGLLSITIDAGSAVATGLDISGGVTAGRFYAVAASAADIAANLLSISGPLVSPNIVVAVGRSATGSGVTFDPVAASKANVAISRNLPNSGPATTVSVQATGDISVTGGNNADRTISGSYVGDGAIAFDTGGDLQFANNAIVTAGTTLLGRGNNVSLGTGVVLRSDSTGGGGSALTLEASANNGTITGDATSSLAAGQRAGDGSEGRTSDVILTQNTGQALSLGRIDAQQLTITNAAGAIGLGDVTTRAAIDLTSDAAITLASATSTGAGVTLRSNNNSVGVGKTGSAATFDISLTGVGVSATGAADSGRDFKVDATTGTATVADNVTAAGIIDVEGASVMLGAVGQSRTQKATGLARYEATAGSLSTAGATAIISNSNNNGATADLSLKASGAIAAVAATLSAGTNDSGRRNVTLSAGGAANLATGAIFANAISTPTLAAGTITQAGDISIARVDSATAVVATSTVGSVRVGTAGAGNESTAPSFNVTANAAGQTASVVNAIAASGNVMAQAVAGSAVANGSGDIILATGGSADASGTAATNIIANATGTARANGTATAGYVSADGASATASGDAGRYIRATGTTSATASGTTMRLGTGSDITATATTGSATANGNAATTIAANGTTASTAMGMALVNIIAAGGAASANGGAGSSIVATGGSADAGGTAGNDIIASATGIANASGTTTTGLIRASGSSASASGNAATDIVAIASANTGSARASGTAERDIIARADGGRASVAISGTAKRDIFASATGGDVTFADATAGRDVIGAGNTISSENARLKAGDDIVLAAKAEIIAGDLELTQPAFVAPPGADPLDPALDPGGNPVVDPAAKPPSAITNLGGQNIFISRAKKVQLTGEIIGGQNTRIEAAEDLILGKQGQTRTISSTGRLELVAGRSIFVAGTLTLRADSDGTGNDPLVMRAGAIAPEAGKLSIDLTGATLAAGNRVAGVEGRQSDIIIAPGVADGATATAFSGLTLGATTNARGLFRAVSETIDGFVANAAGQLDLAGAINLGGALTVVQRLNVVSTDGSVTAGDVRVLGRVDGAARSTGIAINTRDDLVLSAATDINVTNTARNFADPARNGGGVFINAGAAANVTDARARGDIGVVATAAATLTSALAGGTIMLDGGTAIGGQLIAGNDILVTARVDDASVTRAETTYRSIDAQLPDANAFTGPGLADPLLRSAIHVTAARDASLTRGLTADRSDRMVSQIVVNADRSAAVGGSSIANTISARGTTSATITNGLARRGNLEAEAVNSANASGDARFDQDGVTTGNIIARAGAATASGGADGDIRAEGQAFAHAGGKAGRDIIATAPMGVAYATGTAGRNITAMALTIAEATGAGTEPLRDAGNDIAATATGGRALATGRAGNDLIATATGGAGNPGLATIGNGAATSNAGRDAVVSARDGTAAAGSSVAVVINLSAGRDVIASAANATATGPITAGDDIILVASRGNVIATGAMTTTGARGGDVETAATTVAADAFGAIVDPLTAANIRDPLGFTPTLQNLVGANIIIRASGSATVAGRIDAAADYRVGASANADLGGAAALTHTAGNRVVLAAGSVNLRDGLSLVSNRMRANIGSAGATIINAEQNIQGTEASVTAQRKVGATQADAPDVTLSVAATASNGAVAIDSVSGGLVSISAPRSLTVQTVTAARGVEIAGVVTPVAAAPPANDIAVVSVKTITIDKGLGDDALSGAFVAAPVSVAGGAGAALETLVLANGAAAGALRILADTGTASLGSTADVPASIESILIETQTGLARIDSAAAGSIALRGRGIGSTATANRLHATGSIIATADTSVTIGSATSDLGSILVLVNGLATLTTGVAAVNIDLRSMAGLAQTSSLNAGGRIAISGNSVTILTEAVADDDLLVASNTDIAAADARLSAGIGRAIDRQTSDNSAALETRLTSSTGTALLPALVAGTTGYGNGRAQLTEDGVAFADRLTGAPVTGLLGQNIVLTAAADISVGTVLAARDIIAEAGQGLTLGVAEAGRDLLGVSGWRTAANTTIITSARAGDDLVLVAERGDINAASATLLASGLGADSDASDRAAATLADRNTGLKEPFADFATGKAIAGLVGSNLTLAASGDIALGDSEHSAGRDLRIDAGGAISAARLVAGRDLIAVAGISRAADLTLSASASAGDDLVLVAQRGSIRVTSAQLMTAGSMVENISDDAGAQFLADRQTALVDPLTGLAVADLTGRNLVLLARDSIDSSAGSLTAAGDLRVEAGRGVTLFKASAGRDLLAISGWLADGDLIINAPADTVISAGDDLILLARGGRIGSGAATLLATGTGFDNDSDTAAETLGDGVTGLADIHTGKAVAGLAGSNAIVIARDSIVNSVRVGAVRDTRIEAGGAVTLARVDGGRDAIVLAGINQRGDISIIDRASAGDDLILASYNGSVRVAGAPLTAGGGSDSEAGNDAASALFADATTAITDPLSRTALTRLGGGNVLIGASTAIDSSGGSIVAATDVRVEAGLDVALANVTAGRDIAAAAGLAGDAALTLSGAMMAGDDLILAAPRGSITAAGRFSIAATGVGPDNDGGASPRAPSRLDGGTPATHGVTGAAIALQPGSNIILTARDDIDVVSHTLIANADLRAEAGRNISLGTASAVSDLIAVSGLRGDATTSVATAASAGDDLVLVAQRGDVVVTAATLVSGGAAATDDDSSAVATLRLADGITAVVSPLQAILAGAPMDQAIASLDGRNLFLIARDSVDSSNGSLTAMTDLRIEAGRHANVKTAVAGRDLIGVAGWREAGDFTVTGAAQAGDDLLLASQRRDVIVAGATLTVTGAGVNNDAADTSPALLVARIAIVEPLTGDAASSFGNTALASQSGSNLTLAARRDVAGAGASLVAGAGRDVRIEAGRSLVIGAATAGRDLVAIAAVRDTGTLTIGSGSAGDDVVLVASRGAIDAAALVASGTGADSEAGSETAQTRLSDATTLVDDPTRAGGEATSTVRFATMTLAGSNIRTASATATRIDRASAARDVSVRAGTTAEIATNVVSGSARRPLPEVLISASTGDIGINAPNSVTVGGSTDAGRNTTIEAFGATGTIRLLQFAGETPIADTAEPGTSVTMRTRTVFTVASSNLDLNAGGRLVVTDTSDTARFQIDVTGAATSLALGSAKGRSIGTADTGTADFTTRPGFGAPAAAGWQLSDGEFGTIRATNVEIFADRLLPASVKSRNVLIGATTIAMPVQRFAVRASGDIIVTGAIQMVRGAEPSSALAGTSLPVDRPATTLTLGGRLTGQDLSGVDIEPLARSVQLVTLTTSIPSVNGTPVTEQGSIYAPGTTVRLRGDYVALGLEPVANGIPFLSALTDATGPLVTNEDIRVKYLNNPQSTLYQPQPAYGLLTAGASPAIVTATTLLLAPANWALIQNTDRTGQPGGGLNVTRLIVARPAGSDPLVGVFGSIGGRNGVVAPVNVRIEDLNGINPNNVRINGCTALSTASCIVTGLNLSTIAITDPSRILQVGEAPALDVALPLVTGAGNDALWADDDDDVDSPRPAAAAQEIKP